mmetsp:Transcript_18767/g.59006  ORF Transcript_18767/g.59006 Transcript_18767/m.59006 type:complete len:204 (-) Transcript_18767:186-797(-)
MSLHANSCPTNRGHRVRAHLGPRLAAAGPSNSIPSGRVESVGLRGLARCRAGPSQRRRRWSQHRRRGCLDKAHAASAALIVDRGLQVAQELSQRPSRHIAHVGSVPRMALQSGDEVLRPVLQPPTPEVHRMQQRLRGLHARLRLLRVLDPEGRRAVLNSKPQWPDVAARRARPLRRPPGSAPPGGRRLGGRRRLPYHNGFVRW